MIKVKHLDGEMKLIEKEFNTPKEALEYDHYIWKCLGENCSFYYRSLKLGIDNNKTIEENIDILNGQIRFIEDTLKTL